MDRMQSSSPATESEIRERRRLGIDTHDEEWEGVYHVTPSPSVAHQRLLAGLIRALGGLLEHRGGGTIIPDINVFREPAPKPDYRVPDLVFVAAGHEHLIARDGIRGGPPDAVVEILSPGDETYAKLEFYAAIGVPEVIVIEPETRTPEVWKHSANGYVQAAMEAGVSVRSVRLGVDLRRIAGEPPRLEIADAEKGAWRTAAL